MQTIRAINCVAQQHRRQIMTASAKMGEQRTKLEVPVSESSLHERPSKYPDNDAETNTSWLVIHLDKRFEGRPVDGATRGSAAQLTIQHGGVWMLMQWCVEVCLFFDHANHCSVQLSKSISEISVSFVWKSVCIQKVDSAQMVYFLISGHLNKAVFALSVSSFDFYSYRPRHLFVLRKALYSSPSGPIRWKLQRSGIDVQISGWPILMQLKGVPSFTSPPWLPR